MTERDYRRQIERVVHEIDRVSELAPHLSARQLLAVYHQAQEHLDTLVAVLEDEISEQLKAEAKP